ncbi:MAG TPA: TonB-dependent receptor, partial [Polyangiaceae bacterium]|nr:TonB-dependent receptor [Polyangiaceae bacterium]
YPSRAAHGEFRRDLGAVTSHVACGANGACKLTASTSLLSTDSRFDDPESELGLGTTELDLRGRRVEQAFAAELRLGDKVTLVPTLHAAVEDLWIDTLEQAGLRARRLFSRAALGAHVALARGVALHGLVSGECHGTSASGDVPWSFAAPHQADLGLCDEFEPSGRVSLELGESGLKFLANLGRYARVPTLGELYGTSGAVRGNANLVPETGVTLDAGVRALGSASGAALLDGSYLDLFGFARVASDLVNYQRTGRGYVAPYNVDRARILGLEVLAGWRPLSFLLLELAGTLQDPRNTSPNRAANDYLQYRPRLVTTPRVEASFKKPMRGVERAKLTALYYFEAERYADAAGLVVIPAQQSLDFEGELAVLDDHLALRVRVSNVLNQPRADLIGYPLPGRAGYFTLEAKW